MPNNPYNSNLPGDSLQVYELDLTMNTASLRKQREAILYRCFHPCTMSAEYGGKQRSPRVQDNIEGSANDSPQNSLHSTSNAAHTASPTSTLTGTTVRIQQNRDHTQKSPAMSISLRRQAAS